MGSLEPGATYIYERQGGIVYARKFGDPAEKRIEIGWDWEKDDNPSRVRGTNRDQILENQLWFNIRKAATTNPALQEALDRAKIIYELSKKDGEE